MQLNKLLLLIILSFPGFYADSQSVKILFDATKAESAGNADWVIDAGTFNLGFNNGPAVAGTGDEANPSRYPSPLQSGITSSTPESYWKGGISYWGIDCVNHGFTVETLPYNGMITYGNASNLQDLTNYKVFIIPEPNILFTTAEKNAILNFVQNGGGLFMISDHDQSDRNGDGWDSPHVWNDLISNNGVQNQAFGMLFDYVNISQTTSNIPALPGDSILHGPMGNVTQAKWSSGTTLTLNPSTNPTVTGVIYKTGSSTANTNAFCAYSYFGNGKVAGLGDSSPIDDGSGDVNDGLYDGYITDAAGNHRKLLMNITIWLAAGSNAVGLPQMEHSPQSFNIYPNPAYGKININFAGVPENNGSIAIYDPTGKLMMNVATGTIDSQIPLTLDVSTLSNGIYLCRFIGSASTHAELFSIVH